MKNQIKNLIKIIIFLKIPQIILSFLANCTSSFAGDNTNKYSCTGCSAPLTPSEYHTCDCGNNVLYDSSCITGINCGDTNQKSATEGNCNSGTACTTGQKQVLYQCYDVTSDEFPEEMMELMTEEIRFFSSHDPFTFNNIIYYGLSSNSLANSNSDIAVFDFEECKDKILEDLKVTSFNVIVKQEIIEGITNTITFSIVKPFPFNEVIDITDKQYKIYFNIPVNESYVEELDLETASTFLSNNYDIYNIRNQFYQDFCNNIYYNNVDLNLKAKMDLFYKKGDLCGNHSNNCVYESLIDKGSSYEIKCLCNYNDYTGFITKESMIQEYINFKIFKCFSFSINIGFIISFIFIVALVVTSIIFCCCEVHYTKSLIYRKIPPPNPINGENINNENNNNENKSKKDEKVSVNEMATTKNNMNTTMKSMKSMKSIKRMKSIRSMKSMKSIKSNKSKDEKISNNETINDNKEVILDDKNSKNEKTENKEEGEDNEIKTNEELNENEKVKEEEKIKEENYQEKEFEKYQTDEQTNYGKFKYFCSRKFFNLIEFIRIVYFHEKHMSYCLDISAFITSLLLDLFFTCLFYGDSSIYSQYKKGKSLDFVRIAINGILGVIVSRIFFFFLNKLIIYDPTLLDVILDSPNHKIYGIKIVGDFMSNFYIRVIIYFIIQFGICIICFIYLTSFFHRYKKISINALLSFIIGGLLVVIFSFIFSLFYGCCRNTGYKNLNKKKEKREKIIGKWEYEEEEEEEEEEEVEEVEEEKKEFKPVFNTNNGEVLERKGNLPPMRKKKKVGFDDEEI